MTNYHFTLLFIFLSTLSLRRATSSSTPAVRSQFNFYPRSPCGERPTWKCGWYVPVSISIHALLAESDFERLINPNGHAHFYPRSPCGERRQLCCNGGDRNYFYPRSPCGERQEKSLVVSRPLRISIHALLAESDEINPRCPKAAPNFYPRSPCGERP